MPTSNLRHADTYLCELTIPDSARTETVVRLGKLGYRVVEHHDSSFVMYRRGEFPWLAHLLFLPVLGWLLIPLRLPLYRYYVRINIVDKQP
jgi:hypothetical protein